MYSIKATAALTGLGAETLRAWERRYRVIEPRRNASGRRFYSQQDLNKLKLLANLTRHGHAISKLAGLKPEQLQKLASSADEQTGRQTEFADKIVEALSDYRIDQCEQLLKRALMANEPLNYLREVLIPVLRQVGQLWHEQALNVAQEHMFSACVNRILLGMVNNLHSFSENHPSMLFATPSGEAHEFGILMSCLLAAEQKYNCYYLGSQVPVADLIAAARKLNVEMIVIGVVTTPPDAQTVAAVNGLVQAAQTERFDLWLGGGGASYFWPEQQKIPKNCEIILDVDDFYAKARQWRFANK